MQYSWNPTPAPPRKQGGVKLGTPPLPAFPGALKLYCPLSACGEGVGGEVPFVSTNNIRCYNLNLNTVIERSLSSSRERDRPVFPSS
ncbi:hypothetical protein [Coleofasciculus sp. FACHB-1120]|uniref:hypothetical protein n=1 Tax=Coleofasciculus sp. FACHB-1120 TaxID=2692783 RepID=UPI001A7E8CD0|nr:hypothetical protein [Coleofasciculus sp. FACHB-1120]